MRKMLRREQDNAENVEVYDNSERFLTMVKNRTYRQQQQRNAQNQ